MEAGQPDYRQNPFRMNDSYPTDDNSVNQEQDEKPDRKCVKAKEMAEEMENPNRINILFR